MTRNEASVAMLSLGNDAYGVGMLSAGEKGKPQAELSQGINQANHSVL